MLRLGFCGRVCCWVVLNQFGTRYNSLLLAGFKSRPEHSRTFKFGPLFHRPACLVSLAPI